MGLIYYKFFTVW